MTPKNRDKFKNGAQIRTLLLEAPVEGRPRRLETDYYVEGYAARYEPYVLYEDDDGPVYEQFERSAFDGCDMSDVIMQYDHAGHVYARTSNGSLIVEPDDRGLFVAGDLGRSSGARQMHEEISAGLVTRMSWRFVLGDYEYVPETRTFVHHSVRKIYDVSAVSIPANNDTIINARAWADGVIGLAARREAELDIQRRKLRLKIMLGGL